MLLKLAASCPLAIGLGPDGKFRLVIVRPPEARSPDNRSDPGAGFDGASTGLLWGGGTGSKTRGTGTCGTDVTLIPCGTDETLIPGGMGAGLMLGARGFEGWVRLPRIPDNTSLFSSDTGMVMGLLFRLAC